MANKVKGTAPRRHPSLGPNDPLLSVLYDGVDTLAKSFEHAAKSNPDRDCFGVRPLIKMHHSERDINGHIKKWDFPELGEVEYETYSQALKKIKQLGEAFNRYAGLGLGDKLGIYLETSKEWQYVSQACFRRGIILVTCYANLGLDALVHVINQCELTAMVAHVSLVPTLEKIKKDIPTLQKVIVVGGESKTTAFETVVFEKLLAEKYDSIEANLVGPKPDDLAVIMYTSGSTGLPKGVMVSHFNLMSSVAAVSKVIKIVKEDTLLGYLPLAHIFELAAENAILALGARIGYGNPRTLTSKGVGPVDGSGERIGDIAAVRPTIFAGVPRVYDTIRKGALEMVSKGSWLKQWLFNTAYASKSSAIVKNEDTPFWNWLVFSKVGALFGGRLRMLISGGAPLGADTQQFLKVAIGCDILQGYGLTETCGGGTVQTPGTYAPGKVGIPIASCEIKLVDVPDMNYTSEDKPHPRGEVWIRGGNVTLGYYKNPEKTAEDFDEDGWFHTGDIGRWNDDGTLSIIDRKKNLVKLAHGEYVALENLEMIYGTSPFVAPNSLCVHADPLENHVVAVMLPQASYLTKWASENGLGNLSLAELCKHPQVKAAVLADLQRIAAEKKKKRWEHVPNICIFNDEWTPENNMLTASMKLRRKNIVERYQKEIDIMYKKN